MPNVNGGVLDGVRRIGGRFRDLVVDGGLPGAPLGFRLRGATQSGPPVTGTWKPGDVVLDRTGRSWTCTAGGTPGSWSGSLPAAGMYLQAATAVGGYTLVNGTGTITSWTAPSDGALHRVLVFGTLHVTSTETGGAVNVSSTAPDASAASLIMFSASQSASLHYPNFPYPIIIGAGTTVSLVQSSALTGGAAVLWAEIWGS